MRERPIGLAILIVCALLLVFVIASADQSETPAGPASSVRFGTVAHIDTLTLRLDLASHAGQFLQTTVVNVDAMKTVRPGDYVRVELDRDGIVLNMAPAMPPPRPAPYVRG